MSLSLPTAPVLETVAFREEVLFGVAQKLAIDTAYDLDPAEVRTWTTEINRHLAYAWKILDWEELYLVEERAFAPIFNSTASYPGGFLVYALTTGHVGYYVSTGFVPAGSAITNTSYWTPYVLTSTDQFIPLLQGCRRRIGQVEAVFSGNPYTGTCCDTLSLPFSRSARGIEVSCGNATVFVHYKVPPPRFTAELYDSATTYRPGQIRMLSDATAGDLDGQVFRALQATAGNSPAGGQPYWAPVDFPRPFLDYVVQMAAACTCEDLTTAREWKSDALEFLRQEDDNRIAEGKTRRYRLFPSSTRRRVFSGWYCESAVTTTDVPTTLTADCQNEWGDIVLPPTTTEDDAMLLQLSIPFVSGQGYLDVPLGVTAPDTSWKLESGSIEYTGALTDSEVVVPSFVIKNKTTSGFRVLLDGTMGADAADYFFKCAISGATA